MNERWLALGCLSLLSACGGSAVCDPADVAARLAAAAPGGVVTLGACRLEGSFRVPSGVTLEGAGPESTQLVGTDGASVVVRLDTGAAATTLRGVRVEGVFAAGVFATGRGEAVLEQVEVHPQRGVGVGALGVSTLRLTDVDVAGPIAMGGGQRLDPALVAVSGMEPEVVVPDSPEACVGIVPSCTIGETRDTSSTELGTAHQYCGPCSAWITVTATQGIAVEQVALAELTRVTVRGIAAHAVVARDVDRFHWVEGEASDDLGIALWSDALDLQLEDVALSRTASALRFGGTYGAVLTSPMGMTATVRTVGLVVDDSAGYGILQLGASGVHEGLGAHGNHDAALWLGGCPNVELRDLEVADNGFAGVVAVSVGALSVERATIVRTQMRTSPLGGPGGATLTSGDGLQLSGTMRSVALSEVMFDANERVGLLVDLGSTAADLDACGAARDGVCFSDVRVRAATGVRGAIAGGSRTEPSPGVVRVSPLGSGLWDVGIVREGGALDDVAVIAPIDLTGVIAPIDSATPDAVIAPID